MKKTTLLLALQSILVFGQNQKALDKLAADYTQASLPLFQEVLSIPNDALQTGSRRMCCGVKKTLENAAL